MTTIKDIAKVTGFSINTVSNALNNKDNVKRETKEQIQKIASELNYIPNAIARSLVSKKTNLIALVIHSMEDPFYTELTNSLERFIYKSNYKLVLFNHGEDIDRQNEIMDSIFQQGVDGILINPALSEEHIINRMINKGIPFVILVRNYENYRVNFVGIDFKFGFKIIIEHFLKYNRKHILNICGAKITQSSRSRQDAYRIALSSNNIEYNPRLVINNINNEDHLFDQISGLIKSKKEIDAIYCYDYKTTASVLKYCRINSVKIPEDIALIGFNVDEFCENAYIPITAIKYDIRSIGELGWTILKELIDKESKKQIVRNMYTKPEIVIRKSCGE